MNKIQWVKPNGTPIETNDLDATIKVAAELGWTRIEADTNDGDPIVTDGPVTDPNITIEGPAANPDQMDNGDTTPEPPVAGWDDPDTQPAAGQDNGSAYTAAPDPAPTPPAAKTPAKRGRKPKAAK